MLGFLQKKGGWLVRMGSRDKKRTPGSWRKNSLRNLENSLSFSMAEAVGAG